MIFKEHTGTVEGTLTLANPTSAPLRVVKLDTDNVWQPVGQLSASNPSIAVGVGEYAVVGNCQGVDFVIDYADKVESGLVIPAADVTVAVPYTLNAVEGLTNIPATAQSAEIYLWGADASYTVDGAIPAPGIGSLVSQYGTITLDTRAELEGFLYKALVDPGFYITYSS